MASWRHENKEYFDKISSLLCMLLLLLLYRLWQYMRFSVSGEFFGGFAVLDDFIFGFAVSNTPRCPPQNIDSTLIQTAEMTKMKWNGKKV